MNVARRTLGRWLLSAFLERGCDPAAPRRPRRILSVRALTPREAAELNPLAGLVVARTNLRWLPPPGLAGRGHRLRLS